MFVDQRLQLKKAELVGVLESMCQALEPTDTQLQLAQDRYESAGQWLAASTDPLLRSIGIYLQGSTALGTVVKPLGGNEFDVDLVAHLSAVGVWANPAAVKKAIGDRLKLNNRYASILVEMTRCWRLNYANEFHLDITPSIPNAACTNGGELVPDRAVKEWKASNPKGYKALFIQRGLLVPRMRLSKHASDSAQASIEPYPKKASFKGVLARTVQIAKRHRDVYFGRPDMDPALVPISVIVTTLASRSYKYCVQNQVYDGEFDLLCDVIRHMPRFIQTQTISGQLQWCIWNETTIGENFAEKWNQDPKRAHAFFGWHKEILSDLELLTNAEGIDGLRKSLCSAFGSAPATQAMDALTTGVSSARAIGNLVVAPTVGLAIGSSAAASPVLRNTFFGR